MQDTDVTNTEPRARKWTTEFLPHLAILWAIILAIGVYVIVTTVLISKDGVVYIEHAQRLAAAPLQTLRTIHVDPGYPFLIWGAHGLMSKFHPQDSLETWILAAQCAALACRLIAMTLLYLVGRIVVGPRMSFWAVLIIAILPDPAKYGSDALTDWPHLLFLVLGFYLLLLYQRSPRLWVVLLAGVATGLGYLVRPECAQVLIYGAGWLLLSMIKPPEKHSRARSLISIALLLAGFAAVAVPYMNLTGYIFAERKLIPLEFSHNNVCEQCTEEQYDVYHAALLPHQVTEGLGLIINSVCETFLYYFIPAMLIGLACGLTMRTERQAGLLVIALIVLNIAMLLWHRWNHGAISRRFTLPLVVFMALYIPTGIQLLSTFFSRLFTRPIARPDRSHQVWFLLFVATGVAICTPKLLRPLHAENRARKLAANWLKEHTTADDFIYVPDPRIGFYSQRRITLDPDSAGVTYSVRRFLENTPTMSPQGYEPAHSIPIDDMSRLVICRKAGHPVDHAPAAQK